MSIEARPPLTLNFRFKERKMTDTEKKDTIPDQLPVVSWVDFLQEQPPGSIVTVSEAVKRYFRYDHARTDLVAPELQLFCPEPTCNANMFFTSEDGGDSLNKDIWTKTFLTYRCRNCRKYSKRFAITVRLKDKDLCDA